MRAQIRRLARGRYQGFGPTLLAEVLAEEERIQVSREWLRCFLVGEDLWKARRRKKYKAYSRRHRRAKEGELVQLDGSYFDWFEGRASECCLLVFIDDATGL